MKLASHPGPGPTVRVLEGETGIPRSVVQRALKRLAVAGLVNEQRGRANLAQAEEFLSHGLRYVFPASLEGATRGIPTAWAAEPLVQQISSPPGELPPVWPDSKGRQRGLALQPLHPAAAAAAERDPDPGAPPVRPTIDVDVVVEVATRADFHAFEASLRAKHLSEDPGGRNHLPLAGQPHRVDSGRQAGACGHSRL